MTTPTPPNHPDPDDQPPAPGNPLEEVAFMISLVYPKMKPDACRNRAVILQNSLKAEPMIFPACEQ
jgi:hypothetical protein